MNPGAVRGGIGEMKKSPQQQDDDGSRTDGERALKNKEEKKKKKKDSKKKRSKEKKEEKSKQQLETAYNENGFGATAPTPPAQGLVPGSNYTAPGAVSVPGIASSSSLVAAEPSTVAAAALAPASSLPATSSPPRNQAVSSRAASANVETATAPEAERIVHARAVNGNEIREEAERIARESVQRQLDELRELRQSMMPSSNVVEAKVVIAEVDNDRNRNIGSDAYGKEKKGDETRRCVVGALCLWVIGITVLVGIAVVVLAVVLTRPKPSLIGNDLASSPTMSPTPPQRLGAPSQSPSMELDVVPVPVDAWASPRGFERVTPTHGVFTGDFSILALFNPIADTNYEYSFVVYNQEKAGGGTQGFVLMADYANEPSGLLKFETGYQGAPWAAASQTTIPRGEYTAVGVTLDQEAKKVSLYVNGVEDTTNSFSDFAPMSQEDYFDTAGLVLATAGSVRDLRVYDQVLSAEQVLDLSRGLVH